MVCRMKNGVSDRALVTLEVRRKMRSGKVGKSLTAIAPVICQNGLCLIRSTLSPGAKTSVGKIDKMRLRAQFAEHGHYQRFCRYGYADNCHD